MLLLVSVSSAIALAIGGHDTTTLRRQSGDYTLQIAATVKELERGLSGRQSMPPNEGMLFVFATQAEHCMWMKDMHFPLDFIWLNDERMVTHTETNVQPSSYPANYCGNGASRYVIELNAGELHRAGIYEQQILDF